MLRTVSWSMASDMSVLLVKTMSALFAGCGSRTIKDQAERHSGKLDILSNSTLTELADGFLLYAAVPAPLMKSTRTAEQDKCKQAQSVRHRSQNRGCQRTTAAVRSEHTCRHHLHTNIRSIRRRNKEICCGVQHTMRTSHMRHTVVLHHTHPTCISPHARTSRGIRGLVNGAGGLLIL